jgi:hypothetical protein
MGRPEVTILWNRHDAQWLLRLGFVYLGMQEGFECLKWMA